VLKLLSCAGEEGSESVGKPGTATRRDDGCVDGEGAVCGAVDGAGMLDTCTGEVGGGELDPTAGMLGTGCGGELTWGGGAGCDEEPTRVGGTASPVDGIGGAFCSDGALTEDGIGGGAGAAVCAIADAVVPHIDTTIGSRRSAACAIVTVLGAFLARTLLIIVTLSKLAPTRLGWVDQFELDRRQPEQRDDRGLG
jgi:hypothetical protein